MPDLIAFILEIYLDIKHWFKLKKRRKYEKENNLPKSNVWLLQNLCLYSSSYL
jgi:hypothetical protein